MKDKMEISKGLVWSVLGTLILAVAWLSWTHVSYRLGRGDDRNNEQDRQLLQIQRDNSITLTEIKNIKITLAEHVRITVGG